MLIQPDTYIRLIKNCPLNKTYEHTIYFEKPEYQTAYFKTEFEGINFTKQSYQRYNSGVLQVQEKAENLYMCNYLMFQNTAFGDKWFYAFITSIEYVNNVSSRITYEIDVMQTWFFDYKLKECFVEREHTKTDTAGDNLIPENIGVGEYVLEKVEDDLAPFNTRDSYVVVAVADGNNTYIDGDTGQIVGSTIVSGVFTGVSYKKFERPQDAARYLHDMIDENKLDSIINVFQIPKGVIMNSDPNEDFDTPCIIQTIGENLSHSYLDVFKNNPLSTSETGYRPHNKKLYTQPYFGILVTSSSGVDKTYGYEYFNDPKHPYFVLMCATSCTPEARLVPGYYKGLIYNIEEELVCNDFPQCAFSIDTFREYMAQNAGKLVASYVNPIIKAGSPRSSERRSTVTDVIANIGAARDISVLPQKISGTTASYVDVYRHTSGFRLYKYKIRKEYAIIIDSFFDKYGYAVNRIKTPEITNRPYWNYVKTSNCNAIGSVPSNDLDKICKIYDSGITFWNKGIEVGNYSLAEYNRPLQ